MNLVRREQLLALQSALLHGDEARLAFSKWREAVVFDNMDFATARLVPRMYCNVRTLGVEAPILGRMKGLYRHAWVNNRMKLAAGEELIEVLHGHGISSVLLKGAAILARWTDDSGLRPMDDVDVLVRRNQARAAVAGLLGAGYRATAIHADRLTEPEFEEIHAVQLRSPAGVYVDLHWRALSDGLSADQDHTFWDRAEPIRLGEAATYVLSPEDQLYHTCAHAASSGNGVRVDWAVDAAAVLGQVGDRFDWDRFVAHVRRDRIEIPVRAFVALLRDALSIPIPRSVDRRLGSLRPALLARLDFALRRRIRDKPGAVASTFLAFQDFRRRSAQLCRAPAFSAVRPFILAHWRLDGLKPVLAHGLYVAFDRPSRWRPMLACGGRQRLLSKRDLPGLGKLDFTLADERCNPFVTGWSAPETVGRWTDGREAVLAFRPKQPLPRALPIAMKVLPFAAAEDLKVEVWVGKRQVDLWRFSSDHWQWRRFVIDGDEVGASEAAEIALVVRTPCSPLELGLSRDRRQLGVCVQLAHIGYPARADVFGRPLDFRASSADTELLWSGWSTPEPTGCWTDGSSATIGLRLPQPPEGDIFVALEASVPEPPEGRAASPIAIGVNGVHVADVRKSAHAADPVRFIIPRAVIGEDLSVALTMDVPEPFVPRNHGLSADARMLGLHLVSMTLSV